jgi:hypothetical protein
MLSLRKGKRMNITYFLGNGFDVSYGLKTRYSDYYEYLSEQITVSKNKDTNNKNSPEKIVQDIVTQLNDKQKVKQWSDFEIGLGKYISENAQVSTEDFIEAKQLLEKYLLECLRKKNTDEQNIFSINDVNGFYDNLLNPFKKCKPSDEEFFSTFFKDKINFNFLTLNYTFTLENLLSQIPNENGKYKFEKPVHLHGTLTDGIIFGINNAVQLNNGDRQKDKQLTDLLLKPIAVKAKKDRTIEKFGKILQDSDLLIFFGVSFGETDLFWWNRIVAWLFGSSSRKLLVFCHNDDHTDKGAGSSQLKITRDFLLQLYNRFGVSFDFEAANEKVAVVFNPPNMFIHKK